MAEVGLDHGSDRDEQLVAHDPVQAVELARRAVREAIAEGRCAYDASLRLAWSLLTACHLDEGQRVLASIIEVCSVGSPEQVLEWMRCEIIWLREVGQYAESLALGYEAIRLLEAHGDLVERKGAPLHNAMGSTLTVVGDAEGALEHLMLAEKLLPADAPAFKKASIINNVGRAHQLLGDREAAERYFRYGIHLLEGKEPGYIQAVLKGNLAEFYTEIGRAQEAVGLLENAHAICVALDHPRGIATMLHHLGVTYGVLNELCRSKQLLEEACQRRHDLGDHHDMAITEICLARVVARQEGPDQSVELLRRIQSEWADYEKSRIYLKALEAEYEIWRSEDAFEAALVALERFREAASLSVDLRSDHLRRALALRYQVHHLKSDNYRLEERARALEIQSDRDPLTGIRNRRALFRDVDQAIQTAKGAGRQISVVFCDIDHFKNVNDKYSHLIGDRVLQRVAEVLAAHLRDYDVLGRYGGEEFLFCLPGCDEVVGRDVTERMRQALQATDWASIAPTLRITGSFGLAVYHSEESLKDVIERADSALYLAKRTRNATYVLRHPEKSE